MDPNANLFRQITLATRIRHAADNGQKVSEADAEELAELVTALDNWIRRGGFLPTAWERKGQ